MREADLSKRFTAGLRGLPVIAIKLAMVGHYGTAGWPDWLVIGRGITEPRYWFIELKTEKGKLTPLQTRRQEQLKYVGCDVCTLYGQSQVDIWLKLLRQIYDHETH